MGEQLLDLPKIFGKTMNGPILVPKIVCVPSGEALVVEVDPSIGFQLSQTITLYVNQLPVAAHTYKTADELASVTRFEIPSDYLQEGLNPVLYTLNDGSRDIGRSDELVVQCYAEHPVPITDDGDQGSAVSGLAAAPSSAVETIHDIPFPYALAISPDGARVYVTCNSYPRNYGTLAVIDTAANNVIATLALGINIYGVVVSLDNRRVYVARGGGGAINFDVVIIDAASLAIIGNIPFLNMTPSGLAISPDGSHLYACGVDRPFGGFPNGRLAVVDLARGAISQIILLQNNSTEVAISPDGSRVYAASPNISNNNNNGAVSVIDTRTLAVIRDIAVGSGPRGTVVSPNGALIYTVTTGSKLLVVIDARTNTVIRNVSIGVGAWFLALSPDGKTLCASPTTPGVPGVLIDTSTFSLRYLPVDNTCAGVVFSPDGAHLYVADYQGDLVWVIDI